MSQLESRLKEQARTRGFALAGIARAGEADDFARLREWLDRGYAGEMAYMERHAAARRHPAAVLPDVRSVVMVGMEYSSGVGCRASGVAEDASPIPDTRYPIPGRIARYARGPDYHDTLRDGLNRLLA